MNEKKSENSKKPDSKKLAFWMSLICCGLATVQVVCSYLGLNFETKAIVEIVSFVLAILVLFKVLKSDFENKNIINIKNEIKKDLEKELDFQDNNLEKDNDK